MRCDFSRFLIACSLGILVSGVPASADTEYTPPSIGTQITWIEGSGDDRRTRVSTVVANGPDFAVYLYDLNWDDGRPSSYFAEYSGMHIASCASDQPTLVERDRLRAFWPLQTGTELTIEAPDSVTYLVGQAEQHTVSQSIGTAESYKVTSKSGERRMDLTISLELNTAVELAWSDGSKVAAIDVFQQTPLPDNYLAQKIGLCGALLDR